MENPIESIKKLVRAANYLTAAQIYLQDNFFLDRPLSFDDIKPRLLGHWGTCPGINFVYANLNYLIKKHKIDMLFVLGPGHGFPGLQANLFLEGTLQKYYKEATLNEMGIAYISKNFSWPYGFPSHSNPGTPGVILEGGELGYSLSTSYGSILDNPELITACLVGDGEAETGPMAGSWHLNKLIDPKNNGAVLPILHLNGYKISGPTIFGRMTNKELKSLFYGYGYEPIIVQGHNDKIYEKMLIALENAYQSIRSIQERARSKKEIVIAPHWPMIILKTPKGWTGIKTLHGEKIEGNCLSHQVVGTNAKKSKVELKAIEKWMRSYKFNEIFDKNNGLSQDVLDIIPENEYKMGQNKHAFGSVSYKPLIFPDINNMAVNFDAVSPGSIYASSMKCAGQCLKEIFNLNKENKNFRLMSPDETYSNKLNEVFQATERAFVWPTKKWDRDISSAGRVMEILSEHNLQGLAQGYILTGRHAIFASYEAFVQIVSSMADQYVKFLKSMREIYWRGEVASLNYILTSPGWRQDHNGFSHQNPGFISDMLEKHGCFVHVYFPPDANSTLVVLEKCLKSKNEINIIAAGKTDEPQWLDLNQAKKELERGMGIWDFASDDNPDIVISAIGDYLTKEALAAIDILRKITPEVKVRFVNILELTAVGFSGEECRIPFVDFEKYFTKDKPVIFNFYGYPETLKQVLFGEKNQERFLVHGYIENGSTTTPFDMQIRNNTSRWHLVLEALGLMRERGVVNSDKAEKLIIEYKDKIIEHKNYIIKYGVDPEEITNWQWQKNF
jgi:xylulose-5-phosphate/fructose-6-phosphate phosphoketolase